MTKTERLTEPTEEPFELMALLGTGGFAHTYKAKVLDEDLLDDYAKQHDYRLDVVALKVPLNRKKQKVLQREVETNAVLHLRLRKLRALNIVRYLGFEIYDGKFVMVMEFVGDGSLRDRIGKIGRQKRMPVEEAVKITEGILRGLSAIHQEHIFHRDIKPENILMDGSTPKIADLGIARMLEANELASTGAGTLFYMSPETLSKEGASFPSDIWAVGVTLYELVVGKLPFGEADTPLRELVGLICDTEPPLVHQVCPDVPEALSEIIQRSLRKRPEERFAGPDEMIEALRRFQQLDDRLEREAAQVRDLDDAAEKEARLRGLVTRYPRDPRAYQYLGEHFNRYERHGEAVETFKKGLELDDQNPLLHWDLALAYQKVGQRAAAVKSLQKAISLNLDPSLKRHATNLLRALQAGRS